MRGEHGWAASRAPLRPGSSPHARGARGGVADDEVKSRIIPACAGSTPCPIRQALPSWDHPRMRGEHWRAWSAGPPRRGSSPHARGALVLGIVVLVSDGIIPACAGSTRA